MFDLVYAHLCSLLLLLPFVFIGLPTAADSYNSSYPNCPSYNCGGVTISYPFWKMDSEPATQVCGYQGFGINCTRNYDYYYNYYYYSSTPVITPVITLGGDSYQVSRINYESKSFTVSDGSFFRAGTGFNFVNYTSNFSSKEYIECPTVPHGINLETLPLTISTSKANISFHFNCTRCPSFANELSCYDRTSCVHMINSSTEETDWDEYSCSENQLGEIINIYSTSWSSEEVRTYLVVRFELEWRRMDYCDKCEQSNGRCGHHNTTGFICFCTDGTITKGYCEGAHLLNRTIVIVIGVGSTLLSFVIIFIVWCILKPVSKNCVASLKHKTEEDKNIEAFVMEYGSLGTKRYKYSEIKKMTNSFKVKLGEGGFGEVFKGIISDGQLVAVKVLSASKSNGQEFINEVASIGRTSHVNIVTLLGFCFDYKKRALVYEYMPNGSLEKFIHSYVPMETSENIGIKKLYEIALGIARGLDYLHRGCNTRILHLDIKPHNILLDEDFCPKIADFGLAKLYSRKESVVSMLEARGTLGYIAPEVYNRNFGRVSHKSDVYSYGMLLLEMVGGRKNIEAGVGPGRTSEIYFPDWIYKRLHKHDFLLDSITTTEENDYARKMTIVGLQCIQPDPNQRPSVNEVIEMLDGNLETLEFPPKPIFSSPP